MSSSATARPSPSTTSTSRSRPASSSPPWPVGLRQDHHPAHDRRLRGADLGPDRAPGRGRHLAAALQAQRQHRLPELRAVPAPDDLRERRLRPAPQRRSTTPRSGPGSPRCSSSSSCPGYERRKPTQISGGQAQRVALARALINRPSVLLLDEPLGALDLKLRKQMQVELKRIQQEVGITFIFVTHDQEEAMTMSDRIAVMNHGRYEQLGDPAEPVRTSADPVRRRVPRRQQPPGDDPGGRRRRLRRLEARGRDRGPGPGCPDRGPGRLRDRRPPGEDPAARADRSRPRRRQPAARHRPRRLVPRRLDELHRRDARRRLDDRLRAERPARDPRRAVGAGRRGPAGLARRPTRSPSKPAGSRHPTCRSRASSPRAARPCPRPRPASRADGSSSAAHSPSAAVGFGAFLASTAGKGTNPAPSSSTALASSTPVPPSASPSAAASASAEASAEPIASLPPATGTLRFANWVGYMDIDEATNGFPTLERFTKETGIKVDYVEAIDGNETFFTAQLSGPLGAGLPTEWDLVVMTDWMIARLIRLGWLETIDSRRRTSRRTCSTSTTAARSTRTRTSPRRGSPA